MSGEKLSAARVRTINSPGRYSDGNTLVLNVTKNGSKSWIQRIAVDGRRRDIGLGSFPTISLAEARRRALANRVAIANGGDPLADKKRAKTPTFREAAQATFDANRPRWRDSKTARNWMQGMEKRAFPMIGNLRVDRIRRDDVLRILKPIWSVHPDVARKLRQRIRATFKWCQAHGYVEQNVAGEAIDGALPPMPTVRTHHRSLPYTEVRACLETIRTSSATPSARLCLELLILTATRSGEARGARWEEIDLESRVWHISTDRMKTGAAHMVPLSDPAIRVLQRARELGDSPLVFPSPLKPKQALSDMTLMKILHTVGFGDRATVHGFRSSFRTWASECTETAHAVMELCLAHTVGNAVERAYARSDLIDKRRVLMAQWGEVCVDPSATAPLQEQPVSCPGLDGPRRHTLAPSPTGKPSDCSQCAARRHPLDSDPNAPIPDGKLTSEFVLAMSKPGRYGDGHTLYLLVSNTGTKSWVQRLTIQGRRRDIGLGAFPVVSLAKARKLAMANREALSEGRDPLAETRKRRTQTPVKSSRVPTGPQRPQPTRTGRSTHMVADRAFGGLKINDCLNDTCPWSGQPVRADSLMKYQGRVVGFCNPGCRDRFATAVHHFEQSVAR